MADTKISALTELTIPAVDDELVIVDKSDTSMASSGTDKRIKRGNLNSLPGKFPGIIAPSGSHFPFSNVVIAAGRCCIAKFIPEWNMSITLIAFVVTTAAGANDACDVGILDASGNRLVSSGSTLGKLNSLGVQTIPISINLTANTVYYAAFSAATPFGGTAATLTGTNLTGNAAQGFGSTLGLLDQDVHNATFPIPNPYTTSFVSNTPFLWVRES